MTAPSKPVERLSSLLYWATSAALVIFPVAVAWSIAAGALARDRIAAGFPGVVLPETLPILALAGQVGAAAILLCAALYVLWHMRALFGQYRQSHIFNAACARHIHRIGTGLIVLAVLRVVLHPVQVLLLTLSNAPGQRAVSLQLSSSDFGLLLAGGLMIVIGWTMSEAVALAEENRSFV